MHLQSKAILNIDIYFVRKRYKLNKCKANDDKLMTMIIKEVQHYKLSATV